MNAEAMTCENSIRVTDQHGRALVLVCTQMRNHFTWGEFKGHSYTIDSIEEKPEERDART